MNSPGDVRSIEAPSSPDLQRAEQSNITEEEYQRIMIAAEGALNALDKKSLVELKSMRKPSTSVVTLINATMYAIGYRSKDEQKNAFKEFFRIETQRFIEALRSFDRNSLGIKQLNKIEKMIQPFTHESISHTSKAAC